MTQTPEPPKITFPCPGYAIKVIGQDDLGFHQKVTQVLQQYFPRLEADRISKRPSKQGNYIAFSINVTVKSEQQLKDLFHDLKKIPQVRMVL